MNLRGYEVRMEKESLWDSCEELKQVGYIIG